MATINENLLPIHIIEDYIAKPYCPPSTKEALTTILEHPQQISSSKLHERYFYEIKQHIYLHDLTIRHLNALIQSSAEQIIKKIEANPKVCEKIGFSEKELARCNATTLLERLTIFTQKLECPSAAEKELIDLMEDLGHVLSMAGSEEVIKRLDFLLKEHYSNTMSKKANSTNSLAFAAKIGQGAELALKVVPYSLGLIPIVSKIVFLVNVANMVFNNRWTKLLKYPYKFFRKFV